MRIAENPKRFSDLNMPISAIYQLAAPSVPDTVRDEIIEDARERKVPHRETVQRIAAARPDPERPRSVTRPAPVLDLEPEEAEEAEEAFRDARRTVETRSAPLNGTASVGIRPSGPKFGEEAVSVFSAVCLHLFNRDRLNILERVEGELRRHVVEDLLRVISQAETLLEKLAPETVDHTG
jgi:hypothetical protein